MISVGRIILLIATFGCFSSCKPVKPASFGFQKIQIETPTQNQEFVRKIQSKLDQIIIPKLEFDETPLTDALQFLQQKSVELDSDERVNQRGMSIILSVDNLNPIKTEIRDDAPFGFGAEPQLQQTGTITVTLSRQSISLSDAFTELAKQAGLQYTIESHALVFSQQNQDNLGGKVESFRYQISQPVRIALLKLGQGTSLQAAFENQGISFSPYSEANYDLENGNLIITNHSKQIEFIDQVLDSIPNTLPVKTGNPPTIKRYSTRAKSALTRQRVDRIETLLKETLLPEIELIDTPLEAAIKLIESESNRINPKANLKITIVDDGDKGLSHNNNKLASPGKQTEFRDTPITLGASNIPLGKALGYTAQLALATYQVTPNGVMLIQTTHQNNSTTKRYVLPRTVKHRICQKVTLESEDPFSTEPIVTLNEGHPVQTDLKASLQAMGIRIAPKRAIRYDPETEILELTITPDQHAETDLLLQIINGGPLEPVANQRPNP